MTLHNPRAQPRAAAIRDANDIQIHRGEAHEPDGLLDVGDVAKLGESVVLDDLHAAGQASEQVRVREQ